MKRIFFRHLFICLGAFALFVAPISSHASSDDCKNKLREIFSSALDKKENKKLIEEFLGLQAGITMHRLAWAHLKSFKHRGGVNTRKANFAIEKSIIADLLQTKAKKYQGLKDRYDQSALHFYRESLNEAAPELLEIIRNQQGKGEEHGFGGEGVKELFKLNHQDLFTINLMSELEKTQNSINRYKHLSQSPINYIRYINSSLTDKSNATVKNVDHNINRIQKKISDLEKNARSVFAKAIGGNNGECSFSKDGGKTCHAMPLTSENIFNFLSQNKELSGELFKSWADSDKIDIKEVALWCEHALTTCAKVLPKCRAECKRAKNKNYCERVCAEKSPEITDKMRENHICEGIDQYNPDYTIELITSETPQPASQDSGRRVILGPDPRLNPGPATVEREKPEETAIEIEERCETILANQESGKEEVFCEKEDDLTLFADREEDIDEKTAAYIASVSIPKEIKNIPKTQISIQWFTDGKPLKSPLTCFLSESSPNCISRTSIQKPVGGATREIQVHFTFISLPDRVPEVFNFTLDSKAEKKPGGGKELELLPGAGLTNAHGIQFK